MKRAKHSAMAAEEPFQLGTPFEAFGGNRDGSESEQKWSCVKVIGMTKDAHWRETSVRSLPLYEVLYDDGSTDTVNFMSGIFLYSQKHGVQMQYRATGVAMALGGHSTMEDKQCVTALNIISNGMETVVNALARGSNKEIRKKLSAAVACTSDQECQDHVTKLIDDLVKEHISGDLESTFRNIPDWKQRILLNCVDEIKRRLVHKMTFCLRNQETLSDAKDFIKELRML